MQIDGVAYQPRSPRQAIARGLALVTNDRQRSGLVLTMSVAENMTLAALPRLSPGGWLRLRQEQRITAALGQALALRAASPRERVATLSGGNQQKVVLAKWMQTAPRVLAAEGLLEQGLAAGLARIAQSIFFAADSASLRAGAGGFSGSASVSCSCSASTVGSRWSIIGHGHHVRSVLRPCADG